MRSYGRTTKLFRLNGLPLFCTIMELRSASSANIFVTFHLHRDATDPEAGGTWVNMF